MSDNEQQCPNCGSLDARRWQLLSGQHVCSECWSDFQDVPAALRPAAVTTRAGLASVPVATLRKRKPKPLPHTHQLPHDPVRSSLAQRTRLNGTDLLAPTTNSWCILCGHIFYGAKMPRCSRCGGAVRFRSDHDLGLLIRNPVRHIDEGD